MTRYTVVWVQSVEDELVEIWLAAEDRNAVTFTVSTDDRLVEVVRVARL